MKGMADLQPKMKAIQDKYKDNPQKAQQEIMKMYKDLGINPLAGCLPLLVQMPFLIAIFYALQGYPYDPQYAQFLWLPNLSDPDPIYVNDFFARKHSFGSKAIFLTCTSYFSA